MQAGIQVDANLDKHPPIELEHNPQIAPVA
jgi:hypothetical protein